LHPVDPGQHRGTVLAAARLRLSRPAGTLIKNIQILQYRDFLLDKIFDNEYKTLFAIRLDFTPLQSPRLFFAFSASNAYRPRHFLYDRIPQAVAAAAMITSPGSKENG
jgi:hypothetical protein